MNTANSPHLTTNVRLSFVAVTALVFSVCLFSFSIAQAADSVFSDSGITVDRSAPYESYSQDVSEYTDLEMSISYSAELLDSGDTFTYGWRDSEGDHILGTFVGKIEVGANKLTDETGSDSGVISLESGVVSIELFVEVDSNVDSPADEVVIFTLNLTGNKVAVPETCEDEIHNQDETDVDEGGVCTVIALDPETCEDGILNQDEVGVDEGGICMQDEEGGIEEEVSSDEDTYVIEGYVWSDSDEDAVFQEVNSEEVGLEGWELSITDGSTVINTFSDDTGYYSFEVIEGIWTITEVVKKGWNITTVTEYVVAVPEVEDVALIDKVMGYIIPTAYAEIISRHGFFNFGNKKESSGSSATRVGSRSVKKTRVPTISPTNIPKVQPLVVNISDSTPQPLVLGEQVQVAFITAT